MPKALHTSHIKSLPLLHKGKVRDIYDIDEGHMLIVTTDRISAFDVVMPTAIPGKGMVLNQVTRFWMEKLAHIIPNHLSNMPLAQALPDAAERAEVNRAYPNSGFCSKTVFDSSMEVSKSPAYIAYKARFDRMMMLFG